MSDQGNRGNIAQLFGKPWIPAYTESLEPPEIQLRQAIGNAGLVPPEHVFLNGQIHRFSTDGSRKNKSGWYVAFADGVPAGVFGDWKDDGKHSWRADIGRELTALESLEVTERFREASEIRERQRMFKQKATAEECRTIWDSLEAAPEDHPYIYRKGVKAHGARITQDGRLVLPLFDEHGDLCSLQYIDVDGKKMFHPGGKARGCFWFIGEIEGSKKVFIAEGFATAATIHEKTGMPVIIAYNAKNLIPVTASIRSLLPTGSMVIVADHDASQTGQKCAAEAAKASGAEVIVPPEEGDANDFVQAGGDLRRLLMPEISENKFTKTMIKGNAFHHAFLETLNKGWAIKDILPESSGLIILYGQPGTYKSFLAMDMALCMASGINWHTKTTKQKRVIYVAAEGQEGVLKRFEAWRQFHSMEVLSNISLLPIACTLDDPGEVLQLLQALEQEEKPDFIFIDTLARSMAGDENAKVDMGKVIASTDLIRQQFGSQIVLIHHSGKESKGPRGSGSLKGACDTMLETQEGNEFGQIVLVSERQKDTGLASPMGFTMQVVDTGFLDADGEPVTSLVPVLDVDAVPESSRRDNSGRNAKQRERVRDLMAAWAHSGSESVDGLPYLTKSAWKDYMKYENPEVKESTLRQRFKISDEQSMVSRLIGAGVIEEFQAGYVVIDPEISSAMMLSIANEHGR